MSGEREGRQPTPGEVDYLPLVRSIPETLGAQRHLSHLALVGLNLREADFLEEWAEKGFLRSIVVIDLSGNQLETVPVFWVGSSAPPQPSSPYSTARLASPGDPSSDPSAQVDPEDDVEESSVGRTTTSATRPTSGKWGVRRAVFGHGGMVAYKREKLAAERALFKAPTLVPHLWVLILSNNQLQDLPHFAVHLPMLGELRLDHNPIPSDRLVSALRGFTCGSLRIPAQVAATSVVHSALGVLSLTLDDGSSAPQHWNHVGDSTRLLHWAHLKRRYRGHRPALDMLDALESAVDRSTHPQSSSAQGLGNSPTRVGSPSPAAQRPVAAHGTASEASRYLAFLFSQRVQSTQSLKQVPLLGKATSPKNANEQGTPQPLTPSASYSEEPWAWFSEARGVSTGLKTWKPAPMETPFFLRFWSSLKGSVALTAIHQLLSLRLITELHPGQWDPLLATVPTRLNWIAVTESILKNYGTRGYSALSSDENSSLLPANIDPSHVAAALLSIDDVEVIDFFFFLLGYPKLHRDAAALQAPLLSNFLHGDNVPIPAILQAKLDRLELEWQGKEDSQQNLGVSGSDAEKKKVAPLTQPELNLRIQLLKRGKTQPSLAVIHSIVDETASPVATLLVTATPSADSTIVSPVTMDRPPSRVRSNATEPPSGPQVESYSPPPPPPDDTYIVHQALQTEKSAWVTRTKEASGKDFRVKRTRVEPPVQQLPVSTKALPTSFTPTAFNADCTTSIEREQSPALLSPSTASNPTVSNSLTAGDKSRTALSRPASVGLLEYLQRKGVSTKSWNGSAQLTNSIDSTYSQESRPDRPITAPLPGVPSSESTSGKSTLVGPPRDCWTLAEQQQLEKRYCWELHYAQDSLALAGQVLGCTAPDGRAYRLVLRALHVVCPSRGLNPLVREELKQALTLAALPTNRIDGVEPPSATDDALIRNFGLSSGVINDGRANNAGLGVDVGPMDANAIISAIPLPDKPSTEQGNSTGPHRKPSPSPAPSSLQLAQHRTGIHSASTNRTPAPMLRPLVKGFERAKSAMATRAPLQQWMGQPELQNSHRLHPFQIEAEQAMQRHRDRHALKVQARSFIDTTTASAAGEDGCSASLSMLRDAPVSEHRKQFLPAAVRQFLNAKSSRPNSATS